MVCAGREPPSIFTVEGLIKMLLITGLPSQGFLIINQVIFTAPQTTHIPHPLLGKMYTPLFYCNF